MALVRTVTTMKDDAISRSAAVSGISDLLMLELKGERLPTYNEVYRAIYDLPSAQPEIIHCKDCKFYGRVDKRRFYRGSDCLNKRIDTIVPDRDFCSRAERRGEAWMT